MFMTMAINRSVDFNKVNSNISLIPTFQTKKFLEVLSEPIACIKTLQHTVPLKVGPIPISMCSHIILDEIWIKESLLCLLSNSVKYSYGGVIHIKTEIVSGACRRDTSNSLVKASEIHEDENLYIKITVVDDGVGINEDMRKNIFQPLRPSKTASGEFFCASELAGAASHVTRQHC